VKIVVAPDAFKGCLSARQVSQAIGRGVWEVMPTARIVMVPMADGGEGTVQALVEACGGSYVTRTVAGPLGTPVRAQFGLLGKSGTAVIEMAAASGLTLVPPQKRNPLLTNTYGTGQLIVAALDMRCVNFIIGIGGSATNDCGAGMAQALGVRMLTAAGTEIHRVTGGRLKDVAHIDLTEFDTRVYDATFRVACDVDNPLYGPRSAAYVYGPQKGATARQVEELDAGLRHFAAIIERDLGKRVADVPGAGAAGGLGAGLIAFCNATLEPGTKIVSETVGLRDKLRGADLVITGEGRIDRQTAFGKAPSAPLSLAKELGIPVIGIGGTVAEQELGPDKLGFAALFSLVDDTVSVEEAMQPQRAWQLLSQRASEALRCLIADGTLKTAPG